MAGNLPDLMHQVGGDACSRCCQRMSQGDGATIDVGPWRIKAKLLGNSQELGGKGFIDLQQGGVPFLNVDHESNNH